MIHQLQPQHENLCKRQVMAPKIYFRDTGFLHVFLGIQPFTDLLAQPQSGVSWESFALEKISSIAQPDLA